jgi:hypothetical protein
VILIVTCLSKWIAKDNSQGFDVCVVQRPLDLRERCSFYAREVRASATWTLRMPRCRPRSVASLAGFTVITERSPDRHGRGVDYSTAPVECLSAFFIMLIGFERVSGVA